MPAFPLFRKQIALIALSSSWLIASNIASANEFHPLPMGLQDMQVPEVPGLLDGADPVIIDKEKAIILGKALFWDTNIGSDGMACGSCHFHAGADSRTKNQLSPGGKSTDISDQIFDDSLSGQSMGANHNLRAGDFPFHQRATPLDKNSAVIHDSDDVVSSAGPFTGQYHGSQRSQTSYDDCEWMDDPVFNVNLITTRQVQLRNTPTVINAIFNHRSFWDGRANNIFNGSSPWGDRDPEAGVWVKESARSVVKQRLRLINSSLASQALAPPLSSNEMSCKGRSFPDIGRKILSRQPLESQKVHYQDSVLGPLSYSDASQQLPGLQTTYARLIKQAFNPKYWSYRYRGPFGRPATGGLAYSQLEANFSMFFGLAIQMYESTLISDQSRFDLSARDEKGLPIDLTPSELNGLALFRENACVSCHTGPNFSLASIRANVEFNKLHPETFGIGSYRINPTPNVVNTTLFSSHNGFIDTGFAATGVTKDADDIGTGGVDIFGNPLSFSAQYLQFLVGNTSRVIDAEVRDVRPCDFQEAFAINFILPFPQDALFTPGDGVKPQTQSTENCFNIYTAYLPTEEAALAELESDHNTKMVHASNAAFKIPSLRNIELTGPYMHNGGMATLEEVIEFYTRGGNFNGPTKQSEKVFPLGALFNSEQNRKDLVAFLKTLTDDRVRYEKAPFDHPEIRVPHGHVGDVAEVEGGNPLSPALAKDEYLLIEAVGAHGRSKDDPLLPFDAYLAP